MFFEEDPYDRDAGHGDDWVEVWSVLAIVACVIGTSVLFVWFYTKG